MSSVSRAAGMCSADVSFCLNNATQGYGADLLPIVFGPDTWGLHRSRVSQNNETPLFPPSMNVLIPPPPKKRTALFGTTGDGGYFTYIDLLTSNKISEVCETYSIFISKSVFPCLVMDYMWDSFISGNIFVLYLVYLPCEKLNAASI